MVLRAVSSGSLLVARLIFHEVQSYLMGFLPYYVTSQGTPGKRESRRAALVLVLLGLEGINIECRSGPTYFSANFLVAGVDIVAGIVPTFLTTMIVFEEFSRLHEQCFDFLR